MTPRSDTSTCKNSDDLSPRPERKAEPRTVTSVSGGGVRERGVDTPKPNLNPNPKPNLNPNPKPNPNSNPNSNPNPNPTPTPLIIKKSSGSHHTTWLPIPWITSLGEYFTSCLSLACVPEVYIDHSDLTVKVGANMTFSCRVIGTPTPTAYWNTQELHSDFIIETRGSDLELEVVLKISNVSSEDNRLNLTCEAQNRAGPSEESVPLDILYSAEHSDPYKPKQLFRNSL
ncbi:UNVERIFIED_CONTAM: hypothetical protein FKN15_046799 [Acipenser sinensis]